MWTGTLWNGTLGPPTTALGFTALPWFSGWLDWRAAVYPTIMLPALAALMIGFMPLGLTMAEAKEQQPRLWTISRREFWLILAGGLA